MPSPFASFTAPTVYSALGAVPTGLTSVTTATIRVTMIFLTNVGTTDRTITITDTAGTELIKDMPLPANYPAPLLEFPFMKMVGLKWIASGAGINGIVEGYVDA